VGRAIDRAVGDRVRGPILLNRNGHRMDRIEPLAGGVANDVWSVRVNEHLAVGRLGTRSDADHAWETELLQYLDREGAASRLIRARGPVRRIMPDRPWTRGGLNA
jgi:hypothetical protein